MCGKKGGRGCCWWWGVPGFFCFRATRCRDSLRGAGYHRGGWQIKAARLEELWSGFTSSFGSPSDPSWVSFPKTPPSNVVISQNKRGRKICLIGNLPTLRRMELKKSSVRKSLLPPSNQDEPLSELQRHPVAARLPSELQPTADLMQIISKYPG